MNLGSWKVGQGILVGVFVLVFWLLTSASERAIAEDLTPLEAILRLHLGQYVLAVIIACMVGLIAAWPDRAEPRRNTIDSSMPPGDGASDDRS